MVDFDLAIEDGAHPPSSDIIVFVSLKSTVAPRPLQPEALRCERVKSWATEPAALSHTVPLKPFHRNQ
jgi:hypothetical protein